MPKEARGPATNCAFDELVPVEKLVPNPRNPNQHPEAQVALLAKVITHQGWRAPIVVSTRSGFIVAGHGRYEAAKVLGLESVPVDYQEFAVATVGVTGTKTYSTAFGTRKVYVIEPVVRKRPEDRPLPYVRDWVTKDDAAQARTTVSRRGK